LDLVTTTTENSLDRKTLSWGKLSMGKVDMHQAWFNRGGGRFLGVSGISGVIFVKRGCNGEVSLTPCVASVWKAGGGGDQVPNWGTNHQEKK